MSESNLPAFLWSVAALHPDRVRNAQIDSERKVVTDRIVQRTQGLSQ